MNGLFGLIIMNINKAIKFCRNRAKLFEEIRLEKFDSDKEIANEVTIAGHEADLIGDFLEKMEKEIEEQLGYDDKWEFYEDEEGLHRWRRTALNGEIVGASSQGYKDKENCLENAVRNGKPV